MAKRSRSSSRSRSSKKPRKSDKGFKKFSKTYRKKGSVVKKVNQMYNMIETKESTPRATTNQSCPHNNVMVVQRVGGGDLNPFIINQSTADPATGEGARIGDQVAMKGMLIKAFLECAINRPKVFFRIMLVKSAKGDLPSRATLFKGDSENKMIDQVNTERYTIVAQKIFNVACSSAAPSAIVTIPATGEPALNIAQDQRPGIGTKIIKIWIPGRKFGKNGLVQWENGSATQVKFFDYRVLIVAYDWFGTPQDVNNVGKLNDLFLKLYYKDA